MLNLLRNFFNRPLDWSYKIREGKLQNGSIIFTPEIYYPNIGWVYIGRVNNKLEQDINWAIRCQSKEQAISCAQFTIKMWENIKNENAIDWE